MKEDNWSFRVDKNYRLFFDNGSTFLEFVSSDGLLLRIPLSAELVRVVKEKW